MKKRKPSEDGKFEFSAALAEASTRRPTTAGFTQNSASAKTGVDKRIIINMENGEANPMLEKLYPVIRLYGVDSRPIFFPEMVLDTPARNDLRLLLETCSEKEAAVLIQIVRAILDALRGRDGNDLANNT